MSPAIAVPTRDSVLRIWERGRRQHPLDRALTILSACTGLERDAIAALSIAQRDAWLIAVRVALFGRTIATACACTACSEEIEITLRIDELPPLDVRGDAEIEDGGRRHAVRAPDSFDLAAILGTADPSSARRELARRCLGTHEASDTLIDAADARLAQTCGFAILDCRTCCPACGAGFVEPFAIEPFLWTELCWQAERLFDDIAILARCFGWSETDILALSDARRERYVQVAG